MRRQSDNGACIIEDTMSSDAYDITAALWLHHVRDAFQYPDRQNCAAVSAPTVELGIDAGYQDGDTFPAPRGASDNDSLILGYPFRRLPRR